MMHKATRRSGQALGAATIMAAALPWPVPLAAQPAALPAERDLYLECTSLDGERASMTLAINAARQRARARFHNPAGARASYGVRYEPGAIHLFPNREAPNPPPTHLVIDRQSLVLTYWRAAALASQERIVLGTAQCREIAPEPGLMPFEKRSGQ